jgi:O-antigen/teichoic acid export membrane protein
MRRLVLVEVASQAVALLVMVAWAWVDRTIWALVAGGLAASAAKMSLSHLALPGHRNRLRWDPSAARSLFHFGRWIFFSTVLTFLVGQSDRLIFGKMIPLGELGVYSIGLLLATVPPMALTRTSWRIAFPLYSRVLCEGRDLRPVFHSVRRVLLLGGGWTLAGLAGGGPTVVSLLYDERYLGAGWMVQLLAIGGWFAILEATNGEALLARGQAHWVAAGSASKLVGMIALLPLGYWLGGFPGAVVALVAADLLKYLVSASAAARAGLGAFWQDAGLSLVLGASALLGAWTASRIEQGGGHIGLEAAAVFLTVTLVWSPLLLPRLAQARRHGLRALFAAPGTPAEYPS